MTTPVELLPLGNTPTAGMRTVSWADPAGDSIGDLVTNVGPWFTSFGNVSDVAVGIGRVAVGAFVADRATHRNPLKIERDMALRVWVPDPEALVTSVNAFEAMLGFLTGDVWHLDLVQDTTDRPQSPAQPRKFDQVSLLSGGLDSYCGALIGGAANRVFLSHSDSSVITHSQTLTLDVLEELEPDVQRVRLLVPSTRNREASRRSRSFLFIGLALALADAVDAATVEVPENGFTSLNPPLAANRTGVLTTRSTHPWTFELLRRAVGACGVQTQILNPYEWLTKGELLRAAVDAASVVRVQAGLAATMSCAKSNPILANSGFGRNCGLDYSCILRRGAVLAAAVGDTTDYLCTDQTVDQEQLASLRHADISAVRLALQRPPSLEALISRCGPFPDDYDFDAALALWQRGHDELRLVASLDRALPPLDVHAHIDPTVTDAQLATLGPALVFAVTRNLTEAAAVVSRCDLRVVWGCGVHPGVPSAVASYDPEAFRELLENFTLVGEVGLDRRGVGEAAEQVFTDVIKATTGRPLLLTIHSTGQSAKVVDLLGDGPRGAILHWFTGTARQVELAVALGAFFSINVAMTDEQIKRLPRERVLPETDFPFSRKGGSARPGDIEHLEQRVAALWGASRDEVRRGWYENLRELCIQSGTLDSLPAAFASPLLSA